MLSSTSPVEFDHQPVHRYALLTPASHGQDGFRKQFLNSNELSAARLASHGERPPGCGWFADYHLGQGTQRDQMGVKSSSICPTPLLAPHATVSSPTPCPSHSQASVACHTCRPSRASP